jgi:hypothetical protein
MIFVSHLELNCLYADIGKKTNLGRKRKPTMGRVKNKTGKLTNASAVDRKELSVLE